MERSVFGGVKKKTTKNTTTTTTKKRFNEDRKSKMIRTDVFPNVFIKCQCGLGLRFPLNTSIKNAHLYIIVKMNV